MATSTTSNVYIHVIEDVVNKVRDEFIYNGGPGEGVLNQLQGLWELKMIQAGAIVGRPIQRSAGGLNAPVHDLNVPYEGIKEDYETPTVNMLFPPTPLRTPMPTPQTPYSAIAQTPQRGTADNSFYNIPTGGTPITLKDFSPINDANCGHGIGRPSAFMPPPSPWLNQKPPLDVNIAYVEGREDGYRGVHQQPMTHDFFMTATGKRKRGGIASQSCTNGGFIPQLKIGIPHEEHEIIQVDGPMPDPYDDSWFHTPNMYNYQGVVSEDYNVVSTPAPNGGQAPTPDHDEDEPLNENDDDEDHLDDVGQEEDENTPHLVLAQYEKVTHSKNNKNNKRKWKCVFKDGVMQINNKDFLFHKANGEFEF